jgi:hypothetical protein
MLKNGIIRLPKPIESYSSVQKQQKIKNSNNNLSSKQSQVQDFNLTHTKIPWMPEKKYNNDKRLNKSNANNHKKNNNDKNNNDKKSNSNNSQISKNSQFSYSNNSQKRIYKRNNSPKRAFSTPARFAVLNANAHNLSKSEGEQVNWFYAGPKNSPDANDVPLPDLSWRSHFSTHGKELLCSR